MRMALLSLPRYTTHLLTGLLLAACGDSGGPADQGTRVGRYAYQFSAQGLTASGTMVLTYATADSIAGHFEVSAYTPEFSLGFKNQDAYVVYAHPTAGGLAQHRMRPEGSELVCEQAQYFVDFGDIRSGTCSTTYQGP